MNTVTVVDLDRYVRMGSRRPEFDAWFNRAGLGSRVIRIEFADREHGVVTSLHERSAERDKPVPIAFAVPAPEWLFY